VLGCVNRMFTIKCPLLMFTNVCACIYLLLNYIYILLNPDLVMTNYISLEMSKTLE